MDKEEQFIRCLTENQKGLYAYIYTMIGDHSQAHDVLQEANIVMWRKINNFDGKNFDAWAISICKFQAMAFFRDKKRDRLFLDPKVYDLISDTAASEYKQFNKIEQELEECLQTLPEHCRDLIDMRYFQKLSIKDIADKVEKKITAVKVSIHRVRKSLSSCIDEKLKLERG